ncbi:MAG: hypothetical protein GKR93_14830 [Gammaproteobacteria bacterium]|nr:hypothetical protein [Gammaproteobacteria bacterium]
MTIEAPLSLHRDSVVPEWIDYNGHMNVAYYLLVFDHATDAFLDYLGMTDSFRKHNNSSTFGAEIHITYLKEVGLGDELIINTQLIDFDEKRFHYFHQMHESKTNNIVATAEMMGLYMDMNIRRVAAMPESILQRLNEVKTAHSILSEPEQLGRKIGIPRSRN